RNNIFVNTATPAGTAIATAYRRSGSSQTNYHASSNNNLYSCGIAGSNNVIFYNGSSYQTIAAFKSYISPKESLSHSQQPLFLSEDAQSPWYYHPVASVNGPAESAGQSIPNMLDCDGEPRHGHSGYTGNGAFPDIGADEFE